MRGQLATKLLRVRKRRFYRQFIVGINALKRPCGLKRVPRLLYASGCLILIIIIIIVIIIIIMILMILTIINIEISIAPCHWHGACILKLILC